MERGSKMEFREFTGKNVDDAVINASVSLGTSSDKIEYVVVSKGSNGLFGIGSKPAVIKAKIKGTSDDEIEIKEDKSSVEKKNTKPVTDKSLEEIVVEFLGKVFDAMNLSVKVDVEVNEENININLVGEEMGVLIGKRGQTLDSLQYLVSLVVNKYSESYMRVKIDTENYRDRRRETLENLARNIAFKVKRTKRAVSLEPMNPYERRIIHSALQNDRYVTTRSEGDEPYRHVVVVPKRNNYNNSDNR